MTANRDLEQRIADYYRAEPPLRAPDWVLSAALSTIDTTPQRRGLLAPWRFHNMSTYAKLAAAVVVAVAVGIIGWSQFAGPVGGPQPTPTATPTATQTATPGPTIAPARTQSPYVPPALTGTFISDIHGLSMSYPAGWVAQPATVPWTTSSWIFFQEAAGDFLYDPVRTDHLFLELASTPLADASFEQWADEVLGSTGCDAREPIVVDGSEGILCGAAAAVSSGGRGYWLALYLSGDDADLRAFDARAWFDELLATVDLRPEDALDAVPTASP